jgi:outer membrane protein OmpA-like peptidoglycan-associated protein
MRDSAKAEGFWLVILVIGEEIMRSSVVTILAISLVFLNLSCANMNKAQKGAIIGGGTGAATGGVIGKVAGNTAAGAIAGAAIGGMAGGYIGKRMDKQAAEMEKELEGAEVKRVEEGIQITFGSGVLFDVGKATLKPETKANLKNLSESLAKYPDTEILIEGHTDSTGTEEMNLDLSRQRAQSVSNYLAALGVDPRRFVIMGYGESQPVASNDTPEGRQANRRVEIAIMASEELKQEAREKTGSASQG